MDTFENYSLVVVIVVLLVVDLKFPSYVRGFVVVVAVAVVAVVVVVVAPSWAQA